MLVSNEAVLGACGSQRMYTVFVLFFSFTLSPNCRSLTLHLGIEHYQCLNYEGFSSAEPSHGPARGPLVFIKISRRGSTLLLY